MSYTVGHYLFSHHCDGLIEAVKKAVRPVDQVNGAWGDYLPYYGDLVGTAVWQAKFVAGEARRLGLIESEPVSVNLLLEMDVMAGEAT